MPHYKLAFLGFGNVGKALARLLGRKEEELKSKYGITFSAAAIATGSHGRAIHPEGIDLAAALEGGMHALTANKGPVVHGYHDLKTLAEKQGKRFYFESTVMDGAPVFGMFRGALPAAKVTAIRGVLNSTTNLMLSRMEAGESLEDAVTYAQSIGITETDPSEDVDGWDAAIKVCALATVLMDTPLKPGQVDRTGIRGITPEMIAEAKAEGKRWKLVCSAVKEGDKVRAKVAPQMVGPDTPMYTVEGTTSIVQLESDVLGQLSLVESDPSPDTTAYGLLADFVNSVSSD